MKSELRLNNLRNKPECYKFKNLYRLLYNDEYYLMAINQLYKNNGAGTKGINDDTIDSYSMIKIERLIESLKDESYRPKPVKRIYIQKKGGKKMRPLGLPTFTDKLVQEVMRKILENIYEDIFRKESHGFRPRKSTHTALTQIQRHYTGCAWFIEGDIKGFFDNINHDTLISILRKRIDDERFLRLINKFLKCGYVEDWKFNKTLSGCPQGGIVSPILANIYLHELDVYMERLKQTYTIGNSKNRKVNPEYRRLTYLCNQLNNPRLDKYKSIPKEERKKLVKQYQKQLDKIPIYSNSKEYVTLKYTRYADDWIVGVYGDKKLAYQLRSKIQVFLQDKLNLVLNTDKTKVVSSKKGTLFLGYHVSIVRNSERRRNKNGVKRRCFNRRVSLKTPRNFVKNFTVKHKYVKDVDSKEWRMLPDPKVLRNSDLEIVSYYKGVLRGLYNYYQMAGNVSNTMWRLNHVLEYSCLATLASKFKSSTSKIKIKYKQHKTWGIKYQTKQGYKILLWNNWNFKKKQGVFDSEIDKNPLLQPFMWSRTDLYDRVKANKCQICKTTTGKMEIHHVHKLKDLKGKAFHERIMLARKRKTLVVCDKCHYKIHKGEL